MESKPDDIEARMHAALVTPDGPRAWTHDEMRAKFLAHVWMMVDEWSKPARLGEQKTPRDRCAGLAFSMLAMMDGVSVGVPGFALLPTPHKDDAKYHKDRGENWWERAEDEQSPDFVDAYDIGRGGLHDLFYKAAPK